jgi:hypothetical protein
MVNIPEDATPILEILTKSRTLGRPARSTDYLHVSDMVGKCIRKLALIESLGVPAKPQGLSLTDSLTFAQGDAIHDVLKSRVASGGREQIWGNWQCACKTTFTTEPCTLAEVDAARICPACKTPLNVYREVSFRDEEYKVVGNPDLLIVLPAYSALFVSELKSISDKLWKELARPDPDHVIQVLFYWYLVKKAGYRVADRVSVVYATKGWMFSGSPCKEYVFHAPSQVARLQPYLAEAAALKASREGGNLPTRTCRTAQDTTAKNCEVCATCFGASNEKPVSISISSALNGSANTGTVGTSARGRRIAG